jgi:ribosome-associated protein
MDSRQLAQRCRELADDKKAEDIVILDVRKISGITDYFVIASGSSEPHLRAVVEEIRDSIKTECGVAPGATDGALQTAWVVLDYFDVIVHVMRADERKRYDLESLWKDAPRVRPEEPKAPEPKVAAKKSAKAPKAAKKASKAKVKAVKAEKPKAAPKKKAAKAAGTPKASAAKTTPKKASAKPRA